MRGDRPCSIVLRECVLLTSVVQSGLPMGVGSVMGLCQTWCVRTGFSVASQLLSVYHQLWGLYLTGRAPTAVWSC